MSMLAQYVSKFYFYIKQLILLPFLPRWLRYLLQALAVFITSTYIVLFCIISANTYHLARQPALQKADAALILGYRTYLDGTANPCPTGRVDTGLLLAQQGLVSTLIMSGGRDEEGNSIEAEVMATYAKRQGYKGRILLESRSGSTKENLEFSAPILRTANIKSVIIVSEPYHLWRVEKLVAAGHLGYDFSIGYAVAPSQCWQNWGVLSKGALREPLAIMHNYVKGHFSLF